MLNGSLWFPIYLIGNPLSVSRFDFDKLNDQEVMSLAILDSFRMIKDRDLLSLSEDQMIYFLANV